MVQTLFIDPTNELAPSLKYGGMMRGYRTEDGNRFRAMLRRKNKLMRSGRTEGADAIAKQVCAAVTRQSSSWLRTADTRKRTKETWAKVREVIRGSRRSKNTVPTE